MPRSAPRKPSRPTGGPPPRRRQVAGTRARRPAGSSITAEAPDVDDGTEPGAAERAPAGIKESGSTKTRPRPSPKPAPSAKPERKPSRRVLRIPAGRLGLGLTAATVALAITVAILGWLNWQQAQTDAARTDALAAARAHAESILSYDYRRIDADIAKAKKATTGSFSDEYAKTTSTVVKPTAIQYKAVVSAQVRAASVRSVSPDEVVVLLFVNQTTTSTRITGPKVDQSRVRMTLVKSGDDWLVSKIDAL